MAGIFEYKYLVTKDGYTDKSLHGAFARCDTVRFQVIAEAASVVMEIHRDCEPDEFIVFAGTEAGIFTKDISMEMICPDIYGGLYWYRYRIVLMDGTVIYMGGELPRELQNCDPVGDRQLLVYAEGYKIPEKLKGCMIYHVFVDRFRTTGKYPLKKGAVHVDFDTDIPEYAETPGDPVKNNTYYGGDLDGITEKLPYIASLGTELLYLSPVFESPSNHRYDTADYMKVDSMLGGDYALKKLCREAKRLGITVMLDGVFNHTGADSIYFNKFGTYKSKGAYESEDSEYSEWYGFKEFPDDYECWWGVKIMPRVNSANPSWRKFILGEKGVIRKYMKMGVGGWRLDVADEISDVFLDELRIAVREENPEGAVIGEVWEDATNKVAYGKRRRYLRGDQLDSVMNYPFREAVLDYVRYGDYGKFKWITEGIFRRYPEGSVHFAMNMLGTHDTVRTITALAGKSGDGMGGTELKKLRMTAAERKIGKKMSVFAFALMCTLPGAVSVFYGDETGLEGYRDPFCRRPYPWGCEDHGMIEAYSEIGRLKRDTDVLRQGEYEIRAIDENHAEIHRYIGEKRIIAHFCRGESYNAEIPHGYRVLYGKTKLKRYETVILGNF